ncbi:MAG: hypothetical protein HQL50_03870 [Magnetococcales bacterium]|nr:hypothetical protein [Magnetococcales bacterium]
MLAEERRIWWVLLLIGLLTVVLLAVWWLGSNALPDQEPDQRTSSPDGALVAV